MLITLWMLFDVQHDCTSFLLRVLIFHDFQRSAGFGGTPGLSLVAYRRTEISCKTCVVLHIIWHA